jgi:hypothetical protein
MKGRTMLVRLILLLIGIVDMATGVWMLASPDGWYGAVPGVPLTGPNNHHFVSDIGMAYLASGVGLALAFRPRVAGAAFALAGATWPLLHAGIHLWGWMAHGFPATPDVAVTEGVGVILTGGLGFVLATVRARESGIV